MNGLAQEGVDTPNLEKLRRGLLQRIGDSLTVLLDAMRSKLVEFKTDNGRSESGSAEGSAAVGEGPEGAGPTAVGQSPEGSGPSAARETILRDGGCRISERWDTEELLFLSRLVQRGIGQTSQ